MTQLHPSLKIATQNVGGMRGEIRKRGGEKYALLRRLVHRDTDFVVLTEVKADRQLALKARSIKWGLRPTLFSLHNDAHGGVLIFSKPEHRLIEGSIREANTAGHIAAAVYDIQNRRIIVAGIYGEPASNDRASAEIIKEIDSILEDLKHIYNTQDIIIAGDFNVAIHPRDSNNPNHTRKPRTARTLLGMMDNHNLTDLALAANRADHTWFRNNNQGQSSRIDLILTSMMTDNLKVNSSLLFLDHTYLEATFGQPRCKRTQAMKDFILGSEEYLIRSQEIIQEHIEQYPQQQQTENLLTLEEETIDDHPIDWQREFNRSHEGHTALHTFNSLITKLHSLHNEIVSKKAKARFDKLYEPSKELFKLKKKLKTANTDATKNQIHEQICELQKSIKDDLEAKDNAAQTRIKNFYKSRTGKMVPETFSCIKDIKRNRAIHRLEHEGRDVTTPEEIVDIMQKWYEQTADNAPPQLLTLEQFLLEQNIQLPQLNAEECSELEEEFTTDEIKQAISEAKSVSAPGPSGQTISFFKLLMMHIPNLMTQALNQLVFIPHLSSVKCFRWIQERKVIYIPKKSQPVSPSDYRPLSMLEVLYKIPARILARRLTAVLPKLIGPHQHGFMPQKGIQEPSILATHLIEEANKRKKPLQLVSFDIEKAFDKVGHKIITQALRAFGVPEIMVQALQQYTLVGYARVEVNGRQGILITIRTGSGQGDPLSSLLFLLASEPLNRALATNHTEVMYKTEDNLQPGPKIYADDNLLSLSLTSSQDLLPIVNTYDDYQKVSGLKVNINKTAALCINTPADIIQGIQHLGINTPEHIKHLGIHLGKTIESTIEETMRQISPKTIQRRILATTPPTDILHRATLIRTAFLPIYNHVFMAIPITSEHSNILHKETLKFLWTRQREGQTIQKRIRVSKRRIAAEFDMGGLKIPHPMDVITGFQQNLIQRIVQKEPKNIPSLLPEMLRGLLTRIDRPTIEQHIQWLGPVQWRITGNKLIRENTMLGQAFGSIATLLEGHETSKTSWHCAAIDGHSILSNGTLKLSKEEARLLREQEIFTVSQLFTENDAGGLSRMVDGTLINQLALTSPWIRPKLRALTNELIRKQLPITDKYQLQATTGTLLINGEKHLSQIYKKSLSEELTKSIRIAPAYQTRGRDGIYRPDKDTFQAAYKILDLTDIPSKTKETTFEILNRTIWTNNKAFKSGVTDSPNCERCGETETMEHCFTIATTTRLHYVQILAQFSRNPLEK